MFEAKIIEHSISPKGKEILTYALKYPRFIHGEFMTHRVFSRNASSSRAIPVAKMIAMTTQDPAFFVHVGKNQPGMQAKEEVSLEIRALFEKEWGELARINGDFALRWAEKYGIHKQVANRVLEPFQTMSVIVTSTEWENFYELRDHEDAQPEIAHLAKLMLYAEAESAPKLLLPGEWHLPYVTQEERRQLTLEICLRLSAARCARVSYLTHEGKVPDLDADLTLFRRLVGSRPLHASPIEHQATPDEARLILPNLFGKYKNPSLHGNFDGWIQHRKTYELSL